jgi:hypothetical protein
MYSSHFKVVFKDIVALKDGSTMFPQIIIKGTNNITSM